MRIDFTRFTESLSVALDYAEKAFFNIMPLHGMRVALLTKRMTDFLGLGDESVYAIMQAALLHDCALSEYLMDEIGGRGAENNEGFMSAHCEAGEEIAKKLPFYENAHGAVLYHHERADGKGAMGKKAEETPVSAQLIHMADVVDAGFGLYEYDEKKYPEIRQWVRANAGTVFSQECAEAFLNSVSDDTLKAISGEKSRELFEEILPERMVEVSVDTLRVMASIFADITDYKSHFTWRHSMGIAEKAEIMGRYYRLTEEECGKLYLAGALHDTGKLLTTNEILEKPGKLSPEEYKEIQNHAIGTWELLHNIRGLEDITSWAALHHEKLDGSGYPFGYTGESLDRNSRLMACLDIYQALVEDRPYKAGMTHGEAVGILRKMGASGQLDSEIIDDIDRCFGSDEEKKSEASGKNQTESGPLSVPAGCRCPVCGYMHEGEPPEGFVCPQCGQPGSVFEIV